jgi:type I restriction enzyme, S subunit
MTEIVEVDQPQIRPSVAKWKAYPTYKDSGIEWLGEIPEHWEVWRLKYAAPLSTSKLDEKPLDSLYIGLENIESKTGRLLLDALIEIVDSAVGVFEKGNVLFGKLRPYLAKVAYVEFSGVCTTELLVLQPAVFVAAKFLYYRLLSEDFIQLVNSMTYGTKMPRASGEQIGNIHIQLPPIFEQHIIAAFLDSETSKINTLIAKKERLIELLQEKRAALISHAVTKGLDPDVKMKDSGVEWLGEIPEHWDARQFKRVAEISYGLTLELDRTETKGTPIISLPNVTKEGQLLLDDVPLTPLAPMEKETLLLRKGDLLFNWRNGSSDHVGKTAYFDANGEYTHVSFLLRIRFDATRYESRYYQMFLNNLRNTEFFSSAKNRVNKTYNPHSAVSARGIVDFLVGRP